MSEEEKNEKDSGGEKAIVVKLPLKGEFALSQLAFDKAFDFLVNVAKAPAEVVAAIFPGWDGRRRMTRAMAERLAELIKGNAEHEGPADALLLQAWRTQFERESNVLHAVEEAGQLRDDGYHLSPNRALPSGSEYQAGATLPEWFARWRREAEDVTSEEMRGLYARLLAGELESPTAFSMRTLSVVRDLDQRVARLFETLEPHTLIGGVAIPSLKYLMRAPAFDSLGMRPVDMMVLRDAGLVTSAQDAVIDVHVSTQDDGRCTAAMWIGHEWFRFRFQNAAQRPSYQLPVENFTTAGRELLRVLRPADQDHRVPVVAWIASMLATAAHDAPGNVDVYAFPHEAPSAGLTEGRHVWIRDHVWDPPP